MNNEYSVKEFKEQVLENEFLKEFDLLKSFLINSKNIRIFNKSTRIRLNLLIDLSQKLKIPIVTGSFSIKKYLKETFPEAQIFLLYEFDDTPYSFVLFEGGQSCDLVFSRISEEIKNKILIYAHLKL